MNRSSNRSSSLFEHFNLDPQAIHWTGAHEHYARLIEQSVEDRRLAAVIGRYGSGKSYLVEEALRRLPRHDTVWVDHPVRSALNGAQVASQIIRQLPGSEKPTNDTTARVTQAGRIVGQRTLRQNRTVTVVVENAHRVRASFLLELKDLRERMRYHGNAFLFSALLVGQEPLGGLVETHGEVKERTRQLELTEPEGWMTQDMRESYLKTVYEHVVPQADVRERLAAQHPTPLAIDHAMEELMRTARAAAYNQIDERLVKPPLSELREAAGLSVRELAKESGIPKSTVSDVENGRNDDPETASTVRSAIERFEEKRKKQAA